MYALFGVIRVGGTFTLGRYFHASKAKRNPYKWGEIRPIYALFCVISGVEI